MKWPALVNYSLYRGPVRRLSNRCSTGATQVQDLSLQSRFQGLWPCSHSRPLINSHMQPAPTSTTKEKKKVKRSPPRPKASPPRVRDDGTPAAAPAPAARAPIGDSNGVPELSPITTPRPTGNITAFEGKQLWDAANGNVAKMETLIENNPANIEYRNEHGQTPFYMAAYSGKHECLKVMLLTAGADKDCATSFGWTPLIASARNGTEKCIKILLDAGADTATKDGKGKTALDHAKEKGHASIVALLESPDRTINR